MEPETFLPWAALALRSGETHGYAIMGDVETLSGGRRPRGPGTLYGSIKRMLADGVIEESAERPDAELDDQRHRYYRLTALGEWVCASELRRLEGLIRRPCRVVRAHPEARLPGVQSPPGLAGCRERPLPR